MRIKSQIVLLWVCSSLLACGGDAGSQGAAERRAHFTQLPSDPKLAAIYQRSCRACHGLGVSSIPQTGDLNAWQPRLAKGMDVLLDNVINGVGAMPPMGLCMDCEPEQFRQLIEFMTAGAADARAVQ